MTRRSTHDLPRFSGLLVVPDFIFCWQWAAAKKGWNCKLHMQVMCNGKVKVRALRLCAGSVVWVLCETKVATAYHVNVNIKEATHRRVQGRGHSNTCKCLHPWKGKCIRKPMRSGWHWFVAKCGKLILKLPASTLLYNVHLIKPKLAKAMAQLKLLKKRSIFWSSKQLHCHYLHAPNVFVLVLN